jgi:hypothetical protein
MQPPLSVAQRQHLERIVAAGGTATVRSGPLTQGNGWARNVLNLLAKRGLIVLKQGTAGVAPTATITDTGREELKNNEGR